MDLSALNTRAMELQVGTTSKPPPRSTATQTEAIVTKRSQLESTKQAKPKVQGPITSNSPTVANPTAAQTVQVPKVQMPKEQAPKLNNHTSGSKTGATTKTSAKESKPVNYASVAKNASTGGEWAPPKPKRLRIVKRTGEASYPEMLCKLKADPSLSELGKNVRKIRRTQQGELLLEVYGKPSESVPQFKRELEASLKEMASVPTGAHKIALSCSGIDEATTAEELHSCLVNQFQGIQLNPADVRNLRRMRDGTQTASVLLRTMRLRYLNTVL